MVIFHSYVKLPEVVLPSWFFSAWPRVHRAVPQLLQRLPAILPQARSAQAQHQALLGHQGAGLVPGEMEDVRIRGAAQLLGNGWMIYGDDVGETMGKPSFTIGIHRYP